MAQPISPVGWKHCNTMSSCRFELPSRPIFIILQEEYKGPKCENFYFGQEQSLCLPFHTNSIIWFEKNPVYFFLAQFYWRTHTHTHTHTHTLLFDIEYWRSHHRSFLFKLIKVNESTEYLYYCCNSFSTWLCRIIF